MNNNMNFDPNTGMPLNQGNNNQMNFDPNTGMPLNQNMNNASFNANQSNQGGAMNFDPNTGMPLNQGNNNQMNFDPNTGMPINQNMNNNMNYNQNMGNQYNYQQGNMSNPFAQTFQNEQIMQKEKRCEIGFWLSIVGVLISFFGYGFGIIVYIFDFWCASQGMNTSKRGKAIATICISIVSIIILIVEVMLALNANY